MPLLLPTLYRPEINWCTIFPTNLPLPVLSILSTTKCYVPFLLNISWVYLFSPSQGLIALSYLSLLTASHQVSLPLGLFGPSSKLLLQDLSKPPRMFLFTSSNISAGFPPLLGKAQTGIRALYDLAPAGFSTLINLEHILPSNPLVIFLTFYSFHLPADLPTRWGRDRQVPKVEFRSWRMLCTQVTFAGLGCIFTMYTNLLYFVVYLLIAPLFPLFSMTHSWLKTSLYK